MRIVLLSDIHANLEALQAVLSDTCEQQVDEFVCAGDLVDYGPNPNEVIAAVTADNFVSVMGNHDYGVGFDLSPSQFQVAPGRDLAAERAALRWTQQITSLANKKWLASLPRFLLLDRAGFRILLTHALPDDLNAYVSPAEARQLRELHDRYQADIYVLGHLHLPYQDTSTGSLIINPGSVGKPKDMSPHASYALLELGCKAAVEFRRISYDVEAVIKKMNCRGLPKALAAALWAGK